MSGELCDCPRLQKVPEREFCFLIDQRTERKMYIADIDKNVTKVWKERNERKGKRENYEKRHKLCLERIEEDIVHPEDDPEIIYPEDDPVDQEEYSPPITTKENNTEQN